MKDKWKAWKSVRKPMPPPTRVERPAKGQGYKRPQGTWQKYLYGNE